MMRMRVAVIWVLGTINLVCMVRDAMLTVLICAGRMGDMVLIVLLATRMRIMSKLRAPRHPAPLGEELFSHQHVAITRRSASLSGAVDNDTICMSTC